MSKNRIGIEVQVQFPTVAELQKQLAEKWKSVKNSFEGKINIDVDGNSLKQLKTKIKRALGEEVFNIKIDTSGALQGIKEVRSELRELDKKIESQREIKISFNTTDIDKTFRELLENNRKIENAVEEQNKAYKDQGKALDANISKFSKYARIQKQLKDGTISTTKKWSENNGLGESRTVTQRADGRTDVEHVLNREKALKEIEQILKRIHQIETEQVNVEGEQFQLLERERRLQKDQLKILEQIYKEKYKMNSMSDNSIQELKRQQQINLELKMTNALKREEAKEEKVIQDAISKVAQLEQKKQTLARQIVTATESEVTALREQYEHHNRIQQSLKEKYNLSEKMTNEQREELENVRRIGFLERERIKAKQQQLQEEKKLSQEAKDQQKREQQALSDMRKDLKEIHNLEKQIQAIRERQEALGRSLTQAESKKLQILETELQYAKNIARETELFHTSSGNVSDEIREQLRVESEVLQREKDRISAIAKVNAQHDKISADLKEHEKLTSQINQLQRDMIFSGMREQAVIESQISSLREKQKAIRDSLETQGAMTDSLREEIRLTERLQNEQRQLSRDRQDAREKDRAYNDTGGLIDPWSFASNVEQGAMAVFEPIQRLDGALTGIVKVADATTKQFEEFAEGAYDAGSALGVTADEYMLAVEKWVTAGKTFRESQDLAKTSLVGSFVGNISPDDMVKYMSVPLNTYVKDGLEANDIINVMNETANNHAIEMDELGKAYVRAAVSAKDAGVSFEELTGMITGAQEATRKGGERIGTGISAMAINVSNIFSQNTKDFQKKFAFFEDLGVSFEDTNGEMKSMSKIFDELAQKWDKLSDAEKGTAKFYLAGKEHAATMGAILDQWDSSVSSTVNDAVGEIGRGEDGSAFLEHAKQADSVKFKLAELKNAWDELMHTIGGGSGGVSSVLDALVNGLEELNNLAKNEELMKVMKYIFAGLAIHAGANLYKRFFDTVRTGLGGMVANGREAVSLMGQLTGVGKKGKRSSSESVSANSGSTVVSTRRVSTRRGKSNEDRETEETRRRNAQIDAENNTRQDKANSKLKTTGKLLGKVAGFVPILGDALLVLDLMGLPVFDKMGSLLDGLVTSTKELNDELEQTTEKTLAENGVLNGSVITNQKKETDLNNLYQKGTKDGYLNQDEFQAFKEQFNQLSSEIGLVDENGVAIEVTMNDTTDIEAKLKQLQEYLNEVKKVELIDLSKEVNTKTDAIDKAWDEMAERKGFIEDWEAQLVNYQKIVDELKAKQDSGIFLSPSEMQLLSNAQMQVETLTGNISNARATIEEQQTIISTATEGVRQYTDQLVDYLAKGGTLEGMDKEAIKTALGEMSLKFNGLRDDINLADQATKQLNDTNKVQKDTWKSLQEAYPALEGIHIKDVNGNEKVRKKVQEIIDAEKKKKETQADAHKKAIDASAKEVNAKIEVEKATGKVVEKTKEGTKEIENLSGKIEGMPESKEITFFMKIKEAVKGLWNKLFGGKSHTVDVTANLKEGTTSNSVSVGAGSGDAVVSQSVSSAGGSLIQSPASVASIDNATSTKSTKASSTSSSNSAKVNSDIWRYWNSEMKIEDISQAINKLTKSIQESSENQDALIKLYKQQNAQYKNQSTWQSTLSKQKQTEMNEVLKKLKGYGFKTSGNNITNLGISKNFKGDKATEVESLLNQWRQLGTDLTGISESIATISENIKKNNEAIKKAQIQKELEKWETSLKRIDALLTKIDNSDTLIGKRLSYIGDNDSELGLIENEKALNASKSNLSSLITEFNKLSTATINYEENGTSLKTTLDKLGTEILSQADAIIKYQEAINDLEFSRVKNDLSKFNDAIDDNNDKIDNNIKNLKEGLLSGTGLEDLQSAVSTGLDLNRDNKYEQMAQERINLEKEVQEALDSFAKKNIERQKNVSKAQLDITAKMYNQMLQMQKDYTTGREASYSEIVSSFGDLANIGLKDEDYTFVKEIDHLFDEIQKRQDELTKKYESDISKALSADEKDSITNKYIIDSMKIQEDYFQATIDANKKAVEELKQQLADPSLTDEQENQIKTQIQSYEKEITSAQNSIKDSIKDRFEFEFSLIDEAIDQYDKYADELEYAMDILEAIGGDNNSAKGALLENMLAVESARNAQIAESLNSLKSQLSLYQEGSYEWNIINEQVEEYNKLLQDSNKELIDMNKNVMSNSFEGTLGKIEKEMFGGKSIEQYERYKNLWLDGLEREIALEDTYQRLADLESQIHKGKLDQLAKQEKLSKFEMDYLNKQLDVLELQQKLENLNKERTVQTLKQQADGTWDWVYEADSSEVDQVKDDLAQAELEMQQAEEQARKDYISELEDILADVESGEYESVEEFEQAIEDLSQAFDSIVGDFPQIKEEYLKELIEAYSKYITQNGDIMDNVIVNNKPITENTYEGFSKEIVKAFDEISQSIGETFANALISKLPNFGSAVERTNDKSISITLEKLEFPNIKDATGIKDAILSLPQIALQKSKEKL